MVKFSDLKKTDSEPKPQEPDPIKEKDVAETSRFSFRQLEFEKEPALSESDHPSRETHTEKSEALYHEAADYLIQVFDAIRQRKPFEIKHGIQIVEKMAAVQPTKDSLFIKAIHFDDPINFWITHGVNVAIFAMKMAENLGFSPDKQVEIGLLGLLHDVGMGLIPESVIFKKEKLTDQEYKIFKDRPRYAYTILEGFKGQHSFLAECALQVYEKIDGSGYPGGLNGEEIQEYALIIGLVDMYEALVHSRPQRKKFLHFSAIKEIIKTGKGRHKREHLKALLNIFSIFPPYSYVRLNSGAIGQVIETYPDQPMRPRLRIIYNSHGEKVLTDRIINLTENPLLYIVDAVSQEELDNLDSGSEKRLSPKTGEGPETDLSHTEEAGETQSEEPKTAHLLKDSIRHHHRVNKLSMRPFFFVTIIFVILAVFTVGFFNVLKKDPESRQTGMVSTHVISKKIDTAVPAEIPKIPVPPVVFDESRNEPIKSMPDAGDAAVYPYSILFASFRDDEKANDLVTALRERGLSSYRVKVDLGDRGVWHRVFAGYFKDVQEAENQVRQKDLSDASIKKTPFAVLIGAYSSEDAVREKMQSINQLGYMPYVILKDNGQFYLYVGAFYSKQGAEDQCLDLVSRGIPCKIAER